MLNFVGKGSAVSPIHNLKQIPPSPRNQCAAASLQHIAQGVLWVKKQNCQLLIISSLIPKKVFFVELEGVEPSSKQGNHMLSTRLVIGGIFVHWQDRDRQPVPYPLKCRRCIEACNG